MRIVEEIVKTERLLRVEEIAYRLLRFEILGETADFGGFSPLSTRSGKARKTKDRLPFYKGWEGEGSSVPTRRYKRTLVEITVISQIVLCR